MEVFVATFEIGIEFGQIISVFEESLIKRLANWKPIDMNDVYI